MAAEYPKTPPSPEVIAVIAWFAQNAWVTGIAIIFALGRAVFGDVKKDIAEIKEQSAGRDQKLDTIVESIGYLSREVSEIKGELKAKGRSTK